MTGSEIKRLILDSDLKLWQIAERLNLTDSNFSRRLRKPFSKGDVEQIKKIIVDIKKEQKGVENKHYEDN